MDKTEILHQPPDHLELQSKKRLLAFHGFHLAIDAKCRRADTFK